MRNLDSKISQELGKIPPQAVDIEQAVLGAMLLDKTAVMFGTTDLQPESFYKLEHLKIFEAMQTLAESSSAVDVLTVTERLRKEGTLQIVGGPGYISSLTNQVASSAHLQAHIIILKEHQMSRAQIAFGSELVQMAYNATDDVFDINEMMLDRVHDIQHISQQRETVSNSDLAEQLIKKMQLAAEKKGITGTPTGFHEQDILFGGWQPTDLIILAARPGMGKTAKALCDVLNMVTLYGKRVIFFSLEMSALQLFQRLVSVYMAIDGDRIKAGELTDNDWVQFNAKLNDLLTDKLIIVDNCDSVNDIVNKTKTKMLDGDIDAVYVDYLQLVDAKSKNIQNREQEVSYASRRFKMLAKEINAPLIALSQLSRKVDDRADKRPKLSDLRESGAIEQDADIVTFLFRESYYYEDNDDPTTYLIVDKHRNGALKDIQLEWLPKQTAFKSAEKFNQF